MPFPTAGSSSLNILPGSLSLNILPVFWAVSVPPHLLFSVIFCHRADEVAMIMTNLEKANQVSQELTLQELVGLALQSPGCWEICPQK